MTDRLEQQIVELYGRGCCSRLVARELGVPGDFEQRLEPAVQPIMEVV